jgi:hypothetical protein
MLRHVRLSRSLLAWGLGLYALAWCQTAAAQKLEGDLDALKKRAYELRDVINPLLTGQVPYDSSVQDHVDAIQVHAKSVIYPFIKMPSAIIEREGQIDKQFGYVDRDLHIFRQNRDKTAEVSKAYGKWAREAAMEVIKHKSARPIIKVNGARILARLAELGQPELADDLIDVLKGQMENDGARYWALHGLKDLLESPNTEGMDKVRIGKVATAVIEWLSQKPAIIDATPADEIEGYRLLRREAVRALAQTKLPRVDDKVRPAVVLARFAGNDQSIQPPPRFDERLEAVEGLLRMRPSPKEAPGFQPDYTVEQMAHFIALFGAKANNFIEKTGLDRLRPWRTDAANLIPLVMAFRKDVTDDFTKEMTGKMLSVLQEVANNRKASPDDLSTLENAKAPNKGVFQKSPDSEVQPAPPGLLTGERPEPSK